MSAPILFYDGVCNFCNATARFVLSHERAPEFRFAALQSAQARALLAPLGIAAGDLSSMLVLHDGRLLRESDAALHVLSHLAAPWRWLAVFRFVPRGLRDSVYRAIGTRRYRWWGRSEACIPIPATTRTRFLTESE
ncbi:MAG: thiol-disulfide oxidoreductase DCC family protein [Panacagrimonas sp.]